MRKFAMLALVMVAACSGSRTMPLAPTVPTQLAPAPTCNTALTNYLYNDADNDRLRIIQPCITITGWVENWALSDDGDLVLDFRLDAEFKGMLNSVNVSDDNGYLVVEYICQDPTRENTCHGYPGPFVTFPSPTLLRANPMHLRLTGMFVQDMIHRWNELHPVSVTEYLE